ncbi:PREDICTED: N-acetylserotonin O-methyltransferase-like protein [Ceratosolen solmsi marchali]|uniref:N-acetylserotonin O-methyltransferase-like protein n=1 Tax=Ceratosolen solmsi marchali TaxID=326594 RepID=A0AAJ7DU91_9HYME|nr:PREDICTED: N-acetylserotonin O-methyltransferase-like protein [Ceratosolen solmsi marchali]
MLQSTMRAISERRVILASGSPRRLDILQIMGITPEVIPSTFNENLNRDHYKTHNEYVVDLAKHKVDDVYERLKGDSNFKDSLIIGADTIVTKGDIIYGKPKDKKDAFDILSSLVGSTHIVYTGVCIKSEHKEITFCDFTEVTFGCILEEQIRWYIETGEPFDKAGGYGIQEKGGCFVSKINGDFYTVVGLPLYLTINYVNNFYLEYEDK